MANLATTERRTMNKIILAGGSGFLGGALAKHFGALGWEVVILTRTPKPRPDSVREMAWDTKSLGDWARELEGATAVVNLTGRSVDCRYTAKNRREIMESRVNSTRVVGEAIANCKTPPRVWLNSSTATVYTHTFGKPHDESSQDMDSAADAKDAFSVEVAQAWERTLNEANTPKTRKVALRTSMVLGLGRNSVFPVLRRLTKFGLGGRQGSGKQFVSWIHVEDFCRAVQAIPDKPRASSLTPVVVESHPRRVTPNLSAHERGWLAIFAMVGLGLCGLAVSVMWTARQESQRSRGVAAYTSAWRAETDSAPNEYRQMEGPLLLDLATMFKKYTLPLKEELVFDNGGIIVSNKANEIALAKQLARESAEKAGVLDIIQKNQGSVLATIFGRDSSLQRSDDAFNGIVGKENSDAYDIGLDHLARAVDRPNAHAPVRVFDACRCRTCLDGYYQRGPVYVCR